MFSLNEARKIAGLPPIQETEDKRGVEEIYASLLKMSDETDIEGDDEKTIKAGIADQLKKGWLPTEIVKFHKNMVYFSPDMDEEEGLKGMQKVQDAVKKRLGQTNESVETSFYDGRSVRHNVDLLEARAGWSHISDGSMVRFSGDTFPMVAYSDGKIWARNDNGRNPSKTMSTSDLTLKGLKDLISGSITGKMPSDADLKAFLKNNKLGQPVGK